MPYMRVHGSLVSACDHGSNLRAFVPCCPVRRSFRGASSGIRSAAHPFSGREGRLTTRARALVVRTNAVAGLREPMALPLRRQSGGGRKLALRGPGVWPYCNGGRMHRESSWLVLPCPNTQSHVAHAHTLVWLPHCIAPAPRLHTHTIACIHAWIRAGGTCCGQG